MAKAARAAAPAPAEPAPSPALATAVPVPPTPTPPEPATPDAFDMAFAEAVTAAIEGAEPAPKAVSQAAPPAPAEPPKPAPEPPAPEPEEPPAPEPEPLPPVQVTQPQPPPQPQPQPPPQPYQAASPPDPPMFSADEATQLQTFYNDWPDVARAVEVMVQGMLKQTVRGVYKDMASTLAPYFQTIDTLADRSQLSELQTHVSDYDTVAGQLTSWASRQPTYLRSAYEHVIKSGTAAEVVDLINRYKQDTQPATPPPGASPPPQASAQPAPVPVNPALVTAAARLAPVATKRTNVVAPPADFDTAFAEFARAS